MQRKKQPPKNVSCSCGKVFTSRYNYKNMTPKRREAFDTKRTNCDTCAKGNKS